MAAPVTFDDVIAEINEWGCDPRAASDAEWGGIAPPEIRAGFDALDTRGRPEVVFDPVAAAKWIARSRKARIAYRVRSCDGVGFNGTNIIYGVVGTLVGTLVGGVIGWGISRLVRR